MTTHPSDWRNAPARTKRLAAIALAGIVGGGVLTTIFSGAAARAVGPTLIARNADGETLLANPHRLFLVNADEQRTAILPVEELGLRGPVMSLSSDGVDWYLGDDSTGMLHRCDLRARKCVAALEVGEGRRAFRRAHRVTFTTDRIFMTDSESHRLLAFDRAGRRLAATRTRPLALCFPNGIVAVDGDLYIADTNNFRIARIATADVEPSASFLQTNAGMPLARSNCNSRSAGLGERGTPVLNTAIDSANTVARAARPPARTERVWPVSVLRTRGGEWWVIQMANRMRMGDVIRYGADGQPLSRVALPDEADPIELAEVDGGILITDAGLTRVHRVAADGKVAGEWGPRDFRAALGTIARERAWNDNLRRLSIGVIAAGVLAALLVVVAELRRQRAQGWTARGTLGPVTHTPPALAHELVWIGPDADFLRRTRRAVWIIGAYLLVLLGVIPYLARDLTLAMMNRSTMFMFGVLAIVLLFVVALAAVNVSRLPRRRIGVSRDALVYDDGSGDAIRAPWNEVRIGPRVMLIGKHLVQMVDARGRFLYPQREIETQVLSRVTRSGFIGGQRLLFEGLKRGNTALWFTATAFTLYLAFVLLRVFRPEFLREVGALLAGR